MEKDEQQQMEKERGNDRRTLIQIPSYQEVFQASSSSSPQSYNPPTSSISTSAASFSDAFSFIKASEFYTPPPSSIPSDNSDSQPSSSSSSVPQNRNAILVSQRQKGNPLLKHIRNVRWVFADIIPDYLMGQGSCALYLSLRYHLLHPEYLYFRIRELQKNFKLRIVLCHVDVDVVKPLLDVTRTAMLHDCTLLCCWSLEECGRYLETIKVYENKPADSIREQMDTDYLSRLTHALTAVRHVNKTDVVTLGSAFGSLSGIMDASMEDLARCPGIGERKVKRLYDAFHEPFKRVFSRPSVDVSEGPVQEKDNEEVLPRKSNDLVAEGEKLDTSKDTKVSSPNVRSALTAALAKYADKVQKPDQVENRQ
ncbi:putative ERCC1/RAD10/SWI10 family, RuvA domain 2, restriction endonuclease type II [Dioscorea sansibarensis]